MQLETCCKFPTYGKNNRIKDELAVQQSELHSEATPRDVAREVQRLFPSICCSCTKHILFPWEQER
jgi:hypothetical protein